MIKIKMNDKKEEKTQKEEIKFREQNETLKNNT